MVGPRIVALVALLAVFIVALDRVTQHDGPPWYWSERAKAVRRHAVRLE